MCPRKISRFRFTDGYGSFCPRENLLLIWCIGQLGLHNRDLALLSLAFSASSWHVYSAPAQKVDAIDFICNTYAHTSPIYAYEIYDIYAGPDYDLLGPLG